MKEPNFTQITNKDSEIWFVPKKRNFIIGCCDCGLVHSFNFRVKNGEVQFQMKSNKVITDYLRNTNNYKKI